MGEQKNMARMHVLAPMAQSEWDRGQDGEFRSGSNGKRGIPVMWLMHVATHASLLTMADA